MNDLKFAFRKLLKNPGFTVVAVLTLALGIGACTALFSLVHAVLLRPLPFRDSERLVWIENVGSGGLSARTTRVDNFLEWRAQNGSFAELGAYFAFFDYSRYTLIGSGEPRRLPRTKSVSGTDARLRCSATHSGSNTSRATRTPWAVRSP